MKRRYTTDSSSTTTSRRDFLKNVVKAGAGLTLAVQLPSVIAGDSATQTAVAQAFEANAFVRISTDNKVFLIMKHLEMGQGVYTGLATLIAEELEADWTQIITEGAPADTKRYKNLLWGSQGTGGSSAIANSFMQMRQAGAAAKAMLVAAAAAAWKVPATEIQVKQGLISHASSKKQATFGELAELAAQQTVPAVESLTLKDPKDFIYIGQKKLARKDTGKTDGSAIFTQDINLPNLLTAVVAHAPRFGGKVNSVDDSAARAIKGVVDVVQIPSGVAVLAQDFWTAKKGRDALKIDWNETQAITQSSDELMAAFKAESKKAGLPARRDGNISQAMKEATTIIESAYEFPYLAHAALEPMNCVVQVKEDSCELWNGEQMHTLDQATVAQILGLPIEKVKINMLFAGGSFGRRANPHSDYVVEATHIAKAKKGIPIKLVWTREDDMQAGHYRPMYYHHIRAGLDKAGKPIAWEQHIVGQSIIKGTPFESFLIKGGIDATSVEGASNLPYQIPNLHVNLHTMDVNVPVQWWRSVGHTHTAFSTETFIDQLAEKAKQDPVEFRMQLLAGHPRHQGVLKLAAEKANWGTPLPKGRARGIAVHESFNSFVAEVAEVTLHDDGSFSVDRVVCAVDCGVAINPDVIAAQMEGGIGFGLSPALMSEITLDKGKVVQSNFHDYQVLRFNQMPEIEVHIVPSAEPPTGVGEPGVPPIAPAVANALFALTGQTFQQLPLKLS